MADRADQCVVGVFDSLRQAELAVRTLEEAGFSDEHVSLVSQDVEAEVPRGQEETLAYGDATESNAAKGAGLGGLVGLLIGTPLLLIPGIGQVLVAGPLAAGFTGAIVGGFLGAMRGWGVHEDHIRKYEQRVAEGKVLVVACGTPLQVAEANRLLRQSGPGETHLHAPTSADAEEIDDSPEQLQGP